MKTLRNCLARSAGIKNLLGLCLGLAIAQGSGAPSTARAADGDHVFDDVALTHFRAPDKSDANWFAPSPDDLALLDGTEKSFTYNQLRVLATGGVRPDIHITMIFQQLARMKTLEARNYLVQEAKNLVWSRTQLNPEEHKCSDAEHLMCFVIDRGLELAKIIDSQSDHHQPGALDQEIRVMSEALTMARRHYKLLMDFASTPHADTAEFNPNYRDFGKEFAERFMLINEGVLSSYAQYAVAYTILGYFQYDLLRKRLLGDDSANVDANRGAASVIYQTLIAPDMPTPDSGALGDGPTRLRNIEKLWTAFLRAKEILYTYAPPAADIPQLIRRDSGTAASFAPDERVFVNDTFQEAWVGTVEPASDLVYVTAKRGSKDTNDYSPYRSASLSRVIPSNGDFREGDQVADLSDLTKTGRLVATLVTGVNVIEWPDNRREGLSTTRLCRVLPLGDGTYMPGKPVWVTSKQMRQMRGTIKTVYSKGRILVDLDADGLWTGKTEDVKPAK